MDMTPISFSLTPFESTEQTADIDISGTVGREDNRLSIQYLLSGEIGCVDLPTLACGGKRRKLLWEKTCFECFVRPANLALSHYWEINLSPTGDWNVFALSGYRTGFVEERAIAKLPFYTHLSSKTLRLNLSMDLTPLLGNRDALIGLSTVIVSAGQPSYWAIAHPASEADFHHRESFVLRLPYR